MKSSPFVFIESNTTGSGERFVQAACKMGLSVVFLSKNLSKYPYIKTSNVNLVEVDTKDQKAILDALRPYDSISGVFSTSEYFIEMAAKIGKIFNVPANEPRAVSLCRNKDLFYQLNRSSIYKMPTTFVINSSQNLDQYLHLPSLEYPVVIKPSSGSGSVGVKKCLSGHELKEAYTMQESEHVVIQNYVSGPEYSAEILVNGKEKMHLGITKKYTTDSDYFVEIGHDFPAPVPKNFEKQVWRAMDALLEDVGFTYGPAHIEFRAHEGEIVIMELNPRLAGGMIPELISLATGIDIYSLLLKMYMGEKISLVQRKNRGASIRFFIPEKKGILKKVSNLDKLLKFKGIKEIKLVKNPGDFIEKSNDFRDRVGFLITSGKNVDVAREIADQALKQVEIEMDKEKGRLAGKPHQEIIRILRNHADKEKVSKELLRIAQIDQVYLLMLLKQNLLNKADVLPVLKESSYFQENIASCVTKLDFSRGTYYAYENYLRSQVGVKLSGNNHIGRSRNDIQATLLHMELRDALLGISSKLLEVLDHILEKTESSYEVYLPIYSQYQPAAPGTYAYYLTSISNALLRILADLKHVAKEIWMCPLGSGAGVGTEFPIDQDFIADCLGFEAPFSHALDAISNKDTLVRFGAVLANLSVLTSRIAEDYQLWTTVEFSFFELPDFLCGSSSMMPQKKNPYLLEVIKAKSIDTSSEFSSLLYQMHTVPTGNSLQVTMSAFKKLDSLYKGQLEAIELLDLVITHAVPNAQKMYQSHKRGGTLATYFANELMKRKSISFREAHEEVGEIIREEQSLKEDPFDALVNRLGFCVDKGIEKRLKELSTDLIFGGGVGTTPIFIKAAQKETSSVRCWITDLMRKQADGDQRLQKELASCKQNF